MDKEKTQKKRWIYHIKCKEITHFAPFYWLFLTLCNSHNKRHLCAKDLLMSSTLKNIQKKNIAKELYLHGDYTFEEIADKVGAVRQTVSRWAKDEGWPDIKASMTVGKDKMLKNLYAHVQTINAQILEREGAERTPTPKEADILAKLSASISKLETESGIREYVNAGIAFLTWLRGVDPQKAVDYSSLWDAFIKEKLR